MGPGLSAWLYLPAVISALVALWILHIALLRDRLARTPERRRCGGCWYDMRGVPGLRCPECGRHHADDQALRRSRFRWRLVAPAVLLLVPLLWLSIARGDAARAYYALMPRFTTVASGSSGETRWTLERIRDPGERGMRLRVWTPTAVLLEVEDIDIAVGQPSAIFGGSAARPSLLDLDGDGAPELFALGYSGGAHCCYTGYIVRLGPSPRLVAAIGAMNGMGLVSAGGETLLNIPDQSFDYWNAPHVSSPFQSVVYRYRNGVLEVALEHLANLDIPGNTPRAQEAAVICASMEGTSSELNPDMWARMIELLYAGRSEAAWAFFHECWPGHRPGRDAFAFDFAVILSNSPQWRDVQAARRAAAAGLPPPPAEIGRTALPLAPGLGH